MSIACEAFLPLLAAQATGTLADAERSELEEHLLVCHECPDFARRLEGELATVRCEPRDPPATLWSRIERGIEQEKAGHGPSTALKILLACTFCKGGLDRREAIYCAACLAPHHQDCLETYGRCAVSGCGETRTVAPRGLQRKQPRRRFALFLAVAVGAGGVAAFTGLRFANQATVRVPPAESAEALALTDESDRSAPEYPWAPPSNEITKKLLSMKLTFNFAATPFSEVVQFLRDSTKVNIVVAKAIDAEQVKVDLKLREVVGWDALVIIMNQTHFSFEFKNEALVIEPRGGPNEEEAWPKKFSVSDLFASNADGDNQDIVRRLDTQKVNLDLDDKPFAEAIDTLHELTSINFVITREARDLIDNEQLKVKLKVTDVTVWSALALILSAKQDFSFEAKNGVVIIGTAATEAPKGALAPKKISLDLRGVTVPALIQALSEEGVEAYASPAAWASGGTLTLIVHDQRVEDVLLAIGSDSSLRASIVQLPNGGRELVAIDGWLASARVALRRTVPPFAGVATEVRELRDRLVVDLAQRHALRNDPRARPDDLAARERAVNLTASTILSILRRVDRISGARARAEKLAADIPNVEDELAKVEASIPETKADETSRIAALDSRTTTLYDDLRSSEAKRVPRIEELKKTSSVDREAADAIVELERERDNEKRKYEDEREVLQKERTAVWQTSEIKISKLDRRQLMLKRRHKELLHEEGAAQKDVETLGGLERGYRLAEAENPD
jgi:hypothetical protein